jgi:hypothetical protein
MSEKYSQAVSPSCSHDPMQEGGRRETKLVITNNPRRSKEINLKFLLGKIQYEQEQVTEADIISIMAVYEDLLDRSKKGRDSKFFHLRYVLLHIGGFLKKLNLNFREKYNLFKTFLYWPSECRGFLLSAHEYYGLKNGRMKSEGIPRVKWITVRLIKSFQRYIGVGYKDKGSSRDKSWDGSPSLEEVCRDLRYRRTPETIDYSIDDPPIIWEIRDEDGTFVI